MFKRASALATSEDDVVDIRARLAPYGETELSPEWRARYGIAEGRPRHSARDDQAPRPRHLARSTTD